MVTALTYSNLVKVGFDGKDLTPDQQAEDAARQPLALVCALS